MDASTGLIAIFCFKFSVSSLKFCSNLKKKSTIAVLNTNACKGISCNYPNNLFSNHRNQRALFLR